MAKVSLELTSQVEIGKVDQVLVVNDNAGHVIGKLMFSKGSVEWWPKGNSVNAHKYTWKQFATALEDAKPTVRVAVRKAVKKTTTPTAKKAVVPRKRILRSHTKAQ
ncbi:hypothetical protein KDW78_21410 [Burkholderia cenocepacia]|uniref:hypothetical protein n=1 Tax=Burkholderia cenocepacia TaxID=95486 RepID=UPI00158AB7CF|nr:hypothetical protein [Burkholderia cenocepacia]MBR7956434.1 hypothetical protein [Burkholderia cenocepacia]